MFVRRDHAERDAFDESPFDPSRRVLADAVGVDEGTYYDGRVIFGATSPVGPVVRAERVEVELGGDVEHEERAVVLGKPVRDQRRQQEQLVTIAFAEVDRRGPFSRAPCSEWWITDACDSL